MDTESRVKLLKRLGIKDQERILILSAPKTYLNLLSDFPGQVDESISGMYEYIQGFAENLENALILREQIRSAIVPHGVIWLAYPKGSSKKYKSDINRTKLWDFFGDFEYEPVSQVAIDEDWSSIRFKHVDDIKKMSRKNAATEKGKARVQKK